MGRLSVIALAGAKKELMVATSFPPEVQWDKVIQIEIPDDHGDFPDLSGYTAKDYAALESVAEDGQLQGAIQKCVDAVLDYTDKNAQRLERLNFQDIKTTVAGMNTGGKVFVLAGFVSYEAADISCLYAQTMQ